MSFEDSIMGPDSYLYLTECTNHVAITQKLNVYFELEDKGFSVFRNDICGLNNVRLDAWLTFYNKKHWLTSVAGLSHRMT